MILAVFNAFLIHVRLRRLRVTKDLFIIERVMGGN